MVKEVRNGGIKSAVYVTLPSISAVLVFRRALEVPLLGSGGLMISESFYKASVTFSVSGIQW